MNIFPDTELLPTSSLPVMEAFYTLQGEGRHTGRAAYFIRLAGCDVGCFWCDVKESWDASLHSTFEIETIVKNALEAPCKLAVITGGEPLMHNLTALTNLLKAKGFETNIETSGSWPLTGTWDWVCLSPKKFKAPLQEVIVEADELKVIIYNKADFEWAESFARQVKPTCKLYLQVEWEKRETITPLIVQYIKENPKWTLSVQTHKYIHVP